ncbi:response regulator transcription factor [Actibacterium lipolyticum]|uniref:Response regulator MprA n=1 Tax=Actibacterium lipolyticum TaxID=1524263 RepID=A0A238JTS1_9RHOB|nr:DNA-binding response regulator [Actibacterium lipolyticum]SMX33222.1 Response regulator MprA [Actibacterium lipolyticum]
MPPDRTQRSIALVVDDNPDTLGFISSALEENGMTVLIARDGHAALELAERVQPDVILMDAVMPVMDGFETCRRMKAMPDPIAAPILFMTGLTEPEHILNGLNSGGVDYITKPVVIEELIARITTHVINSRLIRSAHDALDSSGRLVLAFDADGTLVWGSPKALQRLNGANEPLLVNRKAQPPFAQWLSGLQSRPLSQTGPYQSGGLQLHYAGMTSAQEILLKMTAQDDTNGQTRLADYFGLTDRESEVLLWLTSGKTNRDLAEILSLSSRTVNKHLEQVFQKMGVDNRTSAAVMADRFLHSWSGLG